MTDYTLIKNELKLIMGVDDNEIEKYDGLIINAASCISSMLSSADYENDARIVHLCAAKAYVKLLLINQGDDVISFKAGDVSYTKGISCIENARQIYAMAADDCREMLKADGFAFKAV